MCLVWKQDAAESLNDDKEEEELMHPPHSLWQVVDSCREFLSDVTDGMRIGQFQCAYSKFTVHSFC